MTRDDTAVDRGPRTEPGNERNRLVRPDLPSVLRGLKILGVWTVLGTFFAGQTWVWQLAQGNPVPWNAAFSSRISYWYAWALVAPAVFAFARRFRLGRSAWARPLAAHTGFALVVAPSQAVLSGLLQLITDPLFGMRSAPVGELGRYFTIRVLYRSFDAFAFYWVLVVVFYTVILARALRERDLRASQLETELAQTELRMLKMQLQPHFLFNTLNAITSLMHTDVAQAERTVLTLSDLLRRTLAASGQQEVRLEDEIAFLERYLQIEQTRFRGRLRVTWTIAPDTRPLLVPNLLLQPLAENAIKHVVARRSSGGHITISVRRDDASLVIEIADDGPGLPPGAADFADSGVGLPATRARLAHLYGSRHAFSLANRPEGGLCVTVTIPARSDDAGGRPGPGLAEGGTLP